jgi:hypothetical protein
MNISRLWLLATIPLFVVGVLGIIRLAMGLVRFTRDAIITSLPVVAEQSFVLPAAGDYSLLTQGRLGERGLGELRFAVFREGGPEVRLSPVLVRSKATSLDGSVRLELFSLTTTTGRHVLRVIGMDPTRDYARNRVVIARGGRGELAVRIVALVLTSVVTLLLLVGSSLLIAGTTR